MRRIVIIGIIVLLAHNIWANEKEPSVSDTIQLDEITFYGDIKRFQPGAKIEEIS